MLRGLVWLIGWSEVVLLWQAWGVLGELTVRQLYLVLDCSRGYQDRPNRQAGLAASRTYALLDLNGIRC